MLWVIIRSAMAGHFNDYPQHTFTKRMKENYPQFITKCKCYFLLYVKVQNEVNIVEFLRKTKLGYFLMRLLEVVISLQILKHFWQPNSSGFQLFMESVQVLEDLRDL